METKPTISEIEQILESHKDTVVEGFYITGHLLEDKIEKRGANFAYVNDILDTMNTEHIDLEAKYAVTPERDGSHHKIHIIGKAMAGSVMHEVTINYFVADTEAEEAEKEELKELLDDGDPMVFENRRAKHGILDARVVDRYEFAANFGAMFGYVISGFDKEYARLMGARCANLMARFFGKKKK